MTTLFVCMTSTVSLHDHPVCMTSTVCLDDCDVLEFPEPRQRPGQHGRLPPQRPAEHFRAGPGPNGSQGPVHQVDPGGDDATKPR